MGDRGNIVVRSDEKDNSGDVWFYTHWTGSTIKETAQSALSRGKGRWDDTPYLARIVFSELVGDNKGETGFGISTSIGDNEHPILVIDATAHRVHIVPESKLEDCRLPANLAAVSTQSWTFEQFIELTHFTP